MPNLNELKRRADELLKFCHCPYSNFRVAAVLEDSRGGLHTGVNVENASYGLTMCAERAALFSAVASGARDFRRIFIHSPHGLPLPCGACRQVLAEFCDDSMEIIVDGNGQTQRYILSELLPHGFSSRELEGSDGFLH